MGNGINAINGNVQDHEKREEMLRYIIDTMENMKTEDIAFVYGLVQGLVED